MSPKAKTLARRAAYGAWLLLSTLLVLALAEYAARKILQAKGEAHPFLIELHKGHDLKAYQREWGGEFVLTYLDPLLGFAHNPQRHTLLRETPGFVSYTTSAYRAAGSGIVIVALGGSTTDPLTPVLLGAADADSKDPYNWPRQLARRLDAEGIAAVVHNGGVSGHSSSQHLIKLIRDFRSMRPDIVLSLDGVNDLAFVQTLPESPLVHRYQRNVMNSVMDAQRVPLFPNLVHLFRREDGTRGVEGTFYGIRNTLAPAEFWIQNCRTARAVTAEWGGTYIAFLQPILGFGDYAQSPHEQEMLRIKGTEYLRGLQDFYSAAQNSLIDGLTVDITHCLNGLEDAYFDPRHQTAAGVEAIAAAVHQELISRGLL